MSRCLISLFMASFGLILAAPLTSAAGTALPTVLSLKVGTPVELGDTARIQASLRDERGNPVKQATLRLYTSATFMSTESGAIEIGDAKTDENGVALFEYVPTRNVTMEVRAEYQGDSRYEPSQATTSFVVEGNRQLVLTEVGVKVPFLNKWLLVGLLSIIWSLYFFVVTRVLRIAQAPPE
ncbi:MAG: hypothetical protein Q7T05_08570 [Dehalococcoidia bacterium]|nr:hypothetical protein [Dehalococcoidia bacterium]